MVYKISILSLNKISLHYLLSKNLKKKNFCRFSNSLSLELDNFINEVSNELILNPLLEENNLRMTAIVQK